MVCSASASLPIHCADCMHFDYRVWLRREPVNDGTVLSLAHRALEIEREGGKGWRDGGMEGERMDPVRHRWMRQRERKWL